MNTMELYAELKRLAVGLQAPPITKDTVDVYHAVVGSVEARHMQAAVDDILRAGMPDRGGYRLAMPTTADLLAACRRARANEQLGVAAVPTWDERPVKCLLCEDTGWVTIYEPRSQWAAVVAVRDGAGESDLRWSTGCVFCSCQPPTSRRLPRTPFNWLAGDLPCPPGYGAARIRLHRWASLRVQHADKTTAAFVNACTREIFPWFRPIETDFVAAHGGWK